MDHGMEDIENGALGEGHLCGLAHGHDPGVGLHRLNLEFVALPLEGCTDQADLIHKGPGPGVRGLTEGKEAYWNIRQASRVSPPSSWPWPPGRSVGRAWGSRR